jgi:hypothetical protein
MPGQESQDMKGRNRTGRTGQAEPYMQNRTDRQNRTGKTGQAKENRQNQDRLNRTVRIGKAK